MFILLLSTLPHAALNRPAHPPATHARRRTIRVRIRRIVIVSLARMFGAIGLDRH